MLDKYLSLHYYAEIAFLVIGVLAVCVYIGILIHEKNNSKGG